MSGPGKDMLVIGVASSALFDLTESHAVFLDQGEDGYRRFQEENLDVQLRPGIAFPFIRRVLGLNSIRPDGDPLVEVIVLSRNDPDTGSRVMKSIETHGLPVSRAVFMQGRSPFKFIPAFQMKLFLSANLEDVKAATALGYPSGQVIGSASSLGDDDPDDTDLRVAFDFDSVLGGDSSEQVYDEEGIEVYRDHEVKNALIPLEDRKSVV